MKPRGWKSLSFINLSLKMKNYLNYHLISDICFAAPARKSCSMMGVTAKLLGARMKAAICMIFQN
jgi:hypothetical protein